MSQTIDIVRGIVREVCPPGTPEIDDPDKAFADYGLDSLDISGVLLACEERFGVKIADEDIDRLTTLSGLVAYLDRAGKP